MKCFYCLSFAFILLFFGCKSEAYHLNHYEGVGLSVDSLVKTDLSAQFVIQPYKDSLEDIIQRSIGHSSQTMYTGKPESPLTNFVADLLLADVGKYLPDSIEQEIDFSVMNVYGLRAPVAEGIITIGDIFRLMPFENKLSIVGLIGQDVQILFDGFAAVGGEGVSGVRFGIKDKKAVDVKIGGQPLDASKVYYAVVSDYLANGGNDMHAMKKSIFRVDLDVKLRDVIMWHIEALQAKNKSITSNLDNRVYEAK